MDDILNENNTVHMLRVYFLRQPVFTILLLLPLYQVQTLVSPRFVIFRKPHSIIQYLVTD